MSTVGTHHLFSASVPFGLTRPLIIPHGVEFHVAFKLFG